MSRTWSGVLLALLLAVALAGAQPAAAEVRRVELSVMAIDEAGEPRSRSALVAEAIEQAVIRVARSLVEPAGAPEAEDARGWARMLGGEPGRFATRVREVAPADLPAGILLSRMAVEVDADGVADALAGSGLVLLPRDTLPEQEFRIRLDTADWRVVARLEDALALHWGARSVPERLVPGRVWLRVTAPGGPEALLDRMLSRPEEGLQIIPLGVEAGTLLLDVAFVDAPNGPGAFDTAD